MFILIAAFIISLAYFIFYFMETFTSLLEFLLLQVVLLSFLYNIKNFVWYYLIYSLIVYLSNLSFLFFKYINLGFDSKIDIYEYTMKCENIFHQILPKFSFFFNYFILWNFLYIIEITLKLIIRSPFVRSTLVFYNVLKWLFEKNSKLTNENYIFFFSIVFFELYV